MAQTSGSLTNPVSGQGSVVFSWSSKNNGVNATISWTLTFNATRNGTNTLSGFSVNIGGYNGGTFSGTKPSMSTQNVMVVNDVASSTPKTSGSFTIKRSETSSGSYIYRGGFTASFTIYINGQGSTISTPSGNWVLPNVTTYSSCTAPKTITASPTSVVEGTRTITVSWSGAAAGKNNPISKYKVYYTTNGTAPTTSTTTYKTTSGTGTSLSIQISGLSANQKIIFKVQTLGTQSSYNSSISSASATVTVTAAHVTPTLTISGTATLYEANGNEGTNNFRLGWCYNPSFSATCNNSGTLSITLKMKVAAASTYNSSYASISGTEYSYSFADKKVTSGSNSFSLNIHEAIKAKNLASNLSSKIIVWRVNFQLNDGVESTSVKGFPSTTTQYYAIANGPTVSAVIPLKSDGSTPLSEPPAVSGTNRYIYNYVKFEFKRDTSFSGSLTASAGSYSATITSDTKNTNATRTVVIKLPDTIPSETTLNISLNFSDSYIMKPIISSNVTIKEATLPSLGGIIYDVPNNANPWTLNSGSTPYEITTTNAPFGTVSTVANLKSTYFIDNLSDIQVIGYVSTSTSSTAYPRTIVSPTISDGNFTAGIVQNSTSQQVFKFGNDFGWGTANYSGSKTYYIRIKVTNIFGKVMYSSYVTKKFNFNYTPTISSYTINWTPRSGSAKNLTSTDKTKKIQEGEKLKFTVNWNHTTAGIYNIKIYKSVGDTVTAILSQNVTAAVRTTYGTASLSTTSEIYTIPEITTDTNNIFYIVITSPFNTTVKSSTWSQAVQPCMTPTLTLTKGTLMENNSSWSMSIYYSYTAYNTNWSITPSTILKYQYYQNSGWIPETAENLKNGSSNISLDLSATSITSVITTPNISSLSSVDTFKIFVQFTAAFTNTIDTTNTTRVYTLVPIIVHTASHTVSLRKNRVGININSDSFFTDSTPDAFLVARSVDSATLIRIDGIGADGKRKTLYYNTATGIITTRDDGSFKQSIDLLNGIFK